MITPAHKNRRSQLRAIDHVTTEKIGLKSFYAGNAGLEVGKKFLPVYGTVPVNH
jgi:hypothetical protein